MLCRGLRQAAANAKQLSWIEQRILASACSSSSQIERFPPNQCIALAQQAVFHSAQACQGLHTHTASDRSLWASSPASNPQLCMQLRGFSSKSDTPDAAEAETAEAATSAAEEHAEAEEQPIDPKDKLIAEKEQQVALVQCTAFSQGTPTSLACSVFRCSQVADYKDKLVHVLADMENLRQRTNRQAEQSRSFAIQVNQLFCCISSLAKSQKTAALLSILLMP